MLKLKKYLLRYGICLPHIQNEDELKEKISKVHPDLINLITSPKQLCCFRADNISSFLNKINTEIDYFEYLDIGCGNGINTKYISSTLGVWGFGIDVVDIISSVLPNNEFSFEKCDGKCIPYSDNSFNLITVINVLHHVFYLKEFLGEINRVLKKGGVLYIEEMCLEQKVTEEDIYFMHKIFGCDEDIYPRTFDEWNDIITFSGFEKIENKSYEDEYNLNYIFYIKK